MTTMPLGCSSALFPTNRSLTSSAGTADSRRRLRGGLILFDRNRISTSFSSFPSVSECSLFLFIQPALPRPICSFLFGRVHKTCSHFNNDYATNRKKPKTLHRFLVRFFGIKMHFGALFVHLQKISPATRTHSTLCAPAQNARFI